MPFGPTITKKIRNMLKRMLFCSIALLGLVSCGGKKTDEGGETPMQEAAWVQLAPEELDFNPFQTIGKDWMALAMGKGEKLNSMTISWGSAGVLWNKPVFTVFVSRDRYSKGLMDESRYFTVMAFPQNSHNHDGLLYIGSHSGRDEADKTAAAGFHVEYSELGNPLFKEADLAFECRIIYKEEFKKELMPQNVREMYSNMGLHTMYVGEIVNVFTRTPQE